MINTEQAYMLAEQVLWLIEDYIGLASQPKRYGTDMLFHRLDIHLIHTIGERPGINVTELATSHDITKSAVSQAVKKLERRHLVERYKREENKKEVLFRLTETGSVAYNAHRSFHENSERTFVEALSHLTEEEAQTVRKLVGILQDRAERVRQLIAEDTRQ